MKLKDNILALYRNEGMRYLFIGGCTTVVNLAVFWLLTDILGMQSKPMMTLANIISVLLAILFAYVTNKLFVFKAHVSSSVELLMEFAKFVGARLFTMIIEVGGVYLLVNIIGQDKMIGKLETQILVIIGNYFISKWFVFTNPLDKKGDSKI